MTLIKQLPPLQKNETAWPWTEKAKPEIYAEGTDFPKISIVTPSYNQGQFIEETILSVLNQNYPNLEYFIIDGGSTDNTVDIIKKYEHKITYWVSEPDNGQTHAINKGLSKATGEIMTWLNSDDYYLPNILTYIANLYKEKKWENIVFGNALLVDGKGKFLSKMKPIVFSINGGVLTQKVRMPQPASFFTKKMYEKYGLDNTLHYAMDMDFWLLMAFNKEKMFTINKDIAYFRQHQDAKSSNGNLPFALDAEKKHRKCLSQGNCKFTKEQSKQILIRTYKYLINEMSFIYKVKYAIRLLSLKKNIILKAPGFLFFKTTSFLRK